MSILHTTIGWIAPPICVGCKAEGSCLCDACRFSEIVPNGDKCFSCNRISAGAKTCANCRRKYALNSVWISTEYTSLAKELIQRYKFGHQRAAVASISKIMAATLLDYNDDDRLTSRSYLLVPVPTASIRIRQRSFDHTLLLSRELQNQLKIDGKSLVGRLGQSKQVGSSRRIRETQAAGSYFIKNKKIVTGRHILLIDDVVTTGATLSEAARILKKAGAASVDALVFAKSL